MLNAEKVTIFSRGNPKLRPVLEHTVKSNVLRVRIQVIEYMYGHNKMVGRNYIKRRSEARSLFTCCENEMIV